MANIKRGDTVQVIAGKDKGVTGTVIAIDKRDSRLSMAMTVPVTPLSFPAIT